MKNRVSLLVYQKCPMPKQKILVIEDQKRLADSLKKGLEENGYESDVAYDGMLGMQYALLNKYHLIILDINLPLVSGYDVCKSIRENQSSIPIIMLTALGTIEDKVSGFDSGADDYLVKPFEFKELLLRIRSLLKRVSNESILVNTRILKVSDLEINLDTKTAKRSGETIELTAKEFALLEYFVRNKGRVISKVDIAEKIWDIQFDTGTNIIEVYVNYLRKKIDKNYSPKLIHTKVGLGYVLKDE